MTGRLCGDARVMTAPAAVDPLLVDVRATVRDVHRAGQARESVDRSGWISGGYWLPMLHEMADTARMDVLDGQRFWWSRCNSMCVVLPAHTDLSTIPCCDKCFQDGMPTRLRPDGEFVWFPQQP
jgi:hypothetical protein